MISVKILREKQVTEGKAKFTSFNKAKERIRDQIK
jgi:hypothetical protein